MVSRVNDYVDLFGWSKPAAPLTEAEQKLLVDSLCEAMQRMRANHGKLDVAFGTVFRVRRDDKSWPVGGSSLLLEGMATLRSIGFGAERNDHTRWGERGQTSTEVVVLSKPLRSYTQPPIGQSDRKDSPHYRDQAEKIFSKAMMKPTWFAKEELLNGHVKTTTKLEWPRKR